MKKHPGKGDGGKVLKNVRMALDKAMNWVVPANRNKK